MKIKCLVLSPRVTSKVSTAWHRVGQDSVSSQGRHDDSGAVDRCRKRAKVVRHLVLFEYTVWIVIRAARECACKISHTCGVHSGDDREWLSRLKFSEPGNSPAAKNMAQSSGTGGEPRYFVHVVNDEAMRAVESRTAPLVAEVEVILRKLRRRRRQVCNRECFVVVTEICAPRVIGANLETFGHTSVELRIACVVFGVGGRFEQHARTPIGIQTRHCNIRVVRCNYCRCLRCGQNSRIGFSLPKLVIRPVACISHFENVV